MGNARTEINAQYDRGLGSLYDISKASEDGGFKLIEVTSKLAETSDLFLAVDALGRAIGRGDVVVGDDSKIHFTKSGVERILSSSNVQPE